MKHCSLHHSQLQHVTLSARCITTENQRRNKYILLIYIITFILHNVYDLTVRTNHCRASLAHANIFIIWPPICRAELYRLRANFPSVNNPAIKSVKTLEWWRMPSAGSVAIQLCVTGSITTGSASWTSISVCTRLCSAHILHYHNCVVGTWLVLEICAREVVVALEQNIFPHCSMRRISAGTCKLLAPKAWHDAEGSDIFQQLVFFGLSVQLLGAVFKFLDCEIISASEFREGFPELVCRPSLLLCPSNSLTIKLTGPAVLSNSCARVWSLDDEIGSIQVRTRSHMQ